MKQIQLTQGKFALVDDEDFEELNKYKWFAAKCNKGMFYARRAETVGFKKQVLIPMHRQILDIKSKNEFGDHIDFNTLNNQRSNLRVCTKRQNCQNRKSRKGSSSKYLGVSLHKKNNGANVYWTSSIRVNGKLIFLGQFPNTFIGEISAAKLYDLNAKKYHGEFANLNFK